MYTANSKPSTAPQIVAKDTTIEFVIREPIPY